MGDRCPRACVPPVSIRYQRSPNIVCYWKGRRLILQDFLSRCTIEGTPLVLEVLHHGSTPIDRDALLTRGSLKRVPADLTRPLVDELVRLGFLREADAARRAGARQERGWTSWNPAAGFFHFATKDIRFTPRSETIRALRQQVRTAKPPAPMLERGSGAALALPEVACPEDLAGLMRARRTWRRFGARALGLEELSMLLGMTWGVQEWIEVDGWGRMPLKTAPSGGARHSIEAYVVARKVSGLRAGIYHYHPERHELKLVKPAASARDIVSYLPEQRWYGSASALVFMTAVFERVQWRYPFPRAYRTVLAEAGHHCQNFCLLATSLGLAPFCTMALADSRIERDLGVDGVRESVIYAAGVGPRPDGIEWAPWPWTKRTPVRTPNPVFEPQPVRGRKGAPPRPPATRTATETRPNSMRSKR